MINNSTEKIKKWKVTSMPWTVLRFLTSIEDQVNYNLCSPSHHCSEIAKDKTTSYFKKMILSLAIALLAMAKIFSGPLSGPAY